MTDSRGTDPRDRFRRVANGMGRSALEAGAEGLKGEIGEAFPQMARFFGQKNPGPVQRKYTQNPFSEDEDEDEDDDDRDYEQELHDERWAAHEKAQGRDVRDSREWRAPPDEDVNLSGGFAGEDEEGDEDDDSTSLAFEYVNAADDNMLLAVAAWRAYAQHGEFIAQHPHTGITFFGNEADFNDFCNHKDMNASNWTRYTDPTAIMAMDHDPRPWKS